MASPSMEPVRRRRRRRGSGRKALLAGAALSVLIAGIALWWPSSRRTSAAVVADTASLMAPGLTVEYFRVENADKGRVLVGQLRNGTPQNQEGVSIHFRVADQLQQPMGFISATVDAPAGSDVEFRTGPIPAGGVKFELHAIYN